MKKNSVKRLAAIDLGTQTFRMMIGETGPSGLRVLASFRENVRLGQGLGRTGKIQPESIERGRAALETFRKALDDFSVDYVRVIGTQALRSAGNSRQFLDQAELLGFHVEVVSGRREAAMALEGVKATLPGLQYPVVMVDIGGGSSEFVLAQRNKIGYIKSFNVGAVTLTEQCVSSLPPGPEDLECLVSRVEAGLSPLSSRAFPPFKEMVAVGGTATTLAAIHLEMAVYDPDLISGLVFTRAGLADLWNRLCAMEKAALSGLRGLEPERADIILGGAALVMGAMRALGAESITVSDGGLLLGLLTTIEKELV